MKKVTFVNKFGPFSNAVTGQNAREVADYLSNNDVEVTFISLKAAYKVSGKVSEKNQSAFKLIELKNFYNGNSPVIRLMFGLLDGFRLWFTSMIRKSDVVIVMTDPPLLYFWFQLFRSFSRRKLYYWTMDLYPEAFVAGKFIKPGNFFYQFLHRIVYKRPPDFAIVLGNKQLEYLEHKYRGPVQNAIVPCGIIENAPIGNRDKTNGFPAKITFGYGGNIGEAHDAEFLISFINNLDPAKHDIVLSLYGSKANYVKKLIEDKTKVIFKEFLTYDDIACIDVNIATLLPDWDHICVPSKAVTAICCGSALLLNTTKEADAWHMFKEGSWLIENGIDYNMDIQKYLGGLDQSSIKAKKINARQLAMQEVSRKHEAFRKIAAAIKG